MIIGERCAPIDVRTGLVYSACSVGMCDNLVSKYVICRYRSYALVSESCGLIILNDDNKHVSFSKLNYISREGS